MPEVEELPKTVSGIIPNFFFDAIGRIVPGAYLVAGVLWVRHPHRIGWILSYFSEKNFTAILGLALALTTLGYFIGFLLAAVSHWLESVMKRISPWKLTMIRMRFGETEGRECRLEQVFNEKFGLRILNDHENIVQCSWLCVFFVWSKNPHLGSMGARWDAEALADRSIATASLIIALTIFFVPNWHSDPYYCLLFFVLLLAFCACVVNYRYRRRQRVFGRFDLFMSLALQSTSPSSSNS